ncbi:hypothetical protein RRG08_055912 [Elysia crispata]|uniref:Uncharacterized protein n=1 Tax=Elysia crispata TaxID=231223 RepID=A0AAE0Y478_9GAST|nr:hypothetical protein RRG08_055912 [Elysia crispata]
MLLLGRSPPSRRVAQESVFVYGFSHLSVDARSTLLTASLSHAGELLRFSHVPEILSPTSLLQEASQPSYDRCSRVHIPRVIVGVYKCSKHSSPPDHKVYPSCLQRVIHHRY